MPDFHSLGMDPTGISPADKDGTEDCLLLSSFGGGSGEQGLGTGA
jgi:hypothetical protein